MLWFPLAACIAAENFQQKKYPSMAVLRAQEKLRCVNWAALQWARNPLGRLLHADVSPDHYFPNQFIPRR